MREQSIACVAARLRIGAARAWKTTCYCGNNLSFPARLQDDADDREIVMAPQGLNTMAV